MPRRSRSLMNILCTILSLCAAITGSAMAAQAPDDRIPVRTADDLPRHTHTVQGKSLDILRDRKTMDRLVDALLADALADLRKYRIEDVATLMAYYDRIALAYDYKGDFKQAIAFSDKAKALMTKEEEKAMSGITRQARIAARLAAGSDEAAYLARFREELRIIVAGLPFELVKDNLIARRNQGRMLTKKMVEASFTAGLDPLLENAKGDISDGLAEQLVGAWFTLNVQLPLVAIIGEVCGERIDANAAMQGSDDRWTPRLVTLDASAKATPVVMGIWDSGVDTSLYPRNLWTNPREQPNGVDDDGNGFVDDLHGIAFGLDRRPTVGPLSSIDGLRGGNKAQLMEFIVAQADRAAGVLNDRVKAYEAFLRDLKAEDRSAFGDDMSLIDQYAHGTHVAGVAVAGNPFARIVHVSELWPWKEIPDEAPTVEFGKRWGDSERRAVEYLKRSGARVVNMSWRVPRSGFEADLTAKGVGASPAERAEMARKIFAEIRSALEEAIRGAPDILFIAGSGNEDNDVDFAEYVPAGLRLPNLITVGAVNAQDRFTDFTSTGKGVELYANGYRIRSQIPGGETVEFSGTSMAAPQVTNLAAKMLALRPEMTPAQVVAAMRENAEPVPGQAGRFIVNPKRTIEALQREP